MPELAEGAELGWYENIGARFKREDGSWVQKGDVFRPTAVELARRRYKLRPSGPPPEAIALGQPADVDPAGPAPAPAAAPAREWPLTMTPARYLAIHPTGPHAALARQLTADAAG